MRQQFVVIRKVAPPQAFILTADFTKEGDVWVATVLELGTSAYGSDIEQAKAELTELIYLHLNEIEKLGFTDAYLDERGIRRVDISSGKQPDPAGKFELTSVP